MADYKDIAGTTVRGNAGVLTSAKTGELFYDSTNENFSYRFPNVTTAGSWRTGSNLNAARKEMGGAGIQTAALAFGGQVDPPYSAANESYDGTSWTEIADLNTARSTLGVGTQTAALAISGTTGAVTAIVEQWNGTSWAEIADLNNGRRKMAGSGTVTSALAFAGDNPADTPDTKKTNESWNGTSWAEVADMNTARRELGGVGSSNTSALAFGGGDPAKTNNESWNGIAWTELADLNTARVGLAGAGIITSALAFGGTEDKNETELWNGTSWAEQNNLSTGRKFSTGAGTATAGLAFGGQNPSGVLSLTEEWTGAGAPIGAWATGGNLNTARAQNSGAGADNTSALAFGGAPIPGVAGKTEQYDGSTWTEVGDMNKGGVERGGTGTATSALAFGIEDPNPPTGNNPDDLTESWNNTAWTEVANLNTARSRMGSAGVSNTSALSFGGTPGGALTESWNGTSWTEVGDLNDSRWTLIGNGTVTSALAAGGEDSPSNTGNTESWNGSAWTEVNNLNTARRESASGGADNTSALVAGGETNSTTRTGVTEEWNGASWVEVADLSTAKNILAGNGTATSALVYGGSPGSGQLASTEEWSGSSITTKVLTD